MDELEIERRLSHIEERAKSNTRRIDEVEKKQEDITDLIQSVATIAQKQTDMDVAVQEIKADIKTITERPARRWDSIVEKVLLTVVAALVGWVLLRLGIGV